MDTDTIIKDLLYNKNIDNLDSLLGRVNEIVKSNLNNEEIEDWVDRDFYDELKTTAGLSNVTLLIGKTLRDLKLKIIDDFLREHTIQVKYKEKKHIEIVSTSIPTSVLDDRVYSSLGDILVAYNSYIDSLTNYFNALDVIDKSCYVIDPSSPTYKDDYRKIVLDHRIWLHVEVTPEGMAINIHLDGQNSVWHDKLQKGLVRWDHDKEIVTNILDIFEIDCFPPKPADFKPSQNTLKDRAQTQSIPAPQTNVVEEIVCSICFGGNIGEKKSLPQPLCSNVKCGIYLHKACLYMWLVASAGGREPPLGIASGACPGCLQPISCTAD